MLAFITRIRSKSNVHDDSDISDEYLSDDALVESYMILYLKWTDDCKARLMATISYSKEEVVPRNSKLEGMTNYTRMLNSRIETLEEILGVGKMSKDVKGIGYNYESSNLYNMFVAHVNNTKFIILEYKSQHHVKYRDHRPNIHGKFSLVCHYYGRRGHIRPYLYFQTHTQ